LKPDRTQRGDTIALVSRLIRENARDYARGYIFVFLLMAIIAGTTGASAWIMQDVIDGIFVAQNAALVPVIAGAVVLIYVIKGAALYAQNIVLNRIGNNIVARTQRAMFDRIVGQSLDFFKAMSMGDLTTRMSRNAVAARQTMELVLMSIGRDALTLVALVIVMVVQNPLMSLVALVVMPLAVWGIANLRKKVKKVARKELVAATDITTYMQQTALGIRVIKAFGLETRMREAMGRSIDDLEKRSNRIADLQARTSPLMETLGGFAIAGVILVGGYQVIGTGAEPGSFFAFITAVLLAYEPAKRLAKFQLSLESYLVGVRMMYEVLDHPRSLTDAPGAGPLAVRRGEVRLEAVDFAYGERPVLEKLDLVAMAGEVTALVGPSGAGKSTVFSLIERFYDPDGGRVLIDGQDIRTVTSFSLRGAIALVTQDTFLFDGSIADNILDGRPGASREAVVEAARAANAHEFIEELEGGYDAPVGQGGGNLSGGQRQRVAIARAMLRDAPILLLDEATSALDAASEAKVQEALARLMKGRTTLVIAHRLSTVAGADRIHVMNAGRVVQSGRHGELLARGGLYADLYALQFRDTDVAQGAA
jgi:ATP-binding cassette subfamily B protein